MLSEVRLLAVGCAVLAVLGLQGGFAICYPLATIH